MRVCYTSDLHGDATLYSQLEDLLRAETPDMLILGGDLVRDIDPHAPALPQAQALEREFMRRMAVWRAAAPRLVVACIVGNHELACTRDAFQAHHDAGRLVLLDHRRIWQHGGFAWLGYACTPPSPHWAKDFERLDRPGDPPLPSEGFAWDAAAQRLQSVDPAFYFPSHPAMTQELDQAPVTTAPWVLVAHAPPHDSHLDRLPHVPHPIGSRAIRRFIEGRQPVLSLHGHVHESPNVTGHFTDRLGQTLCVNPGQSHDQLYAVLFDVERPEQTLRHTVLA